MPVPYRQKAVGFTSNNGRNYNDCGPFVISSSNVFVTAVRTASRRHYSILFVDVALQPELIDDSTFLKVSRSSCSHGPVIQPRSRSVRWCCSGNNFIFRLFQRLPRSSAEGQVPNAHIIIIASFFGSLDPIKLVVETLNPKLVEPH